MMLVGNLGLEAETCVSKCCIDARLMGEAVNERTRRWVAIMDGRWGEEQTKRKSKVGHYRG